MNTHLKKLESDKRLKRFVTLSISIFTVITLLSFLFFTSCNNDDVCNVNYSNVFNVILLTCGIIGISYGFMILKDFNHKIDHEIIQNYKEMLSDSDKDKDDKLSFEHINKKKKLSFF
jgi:uncharacterized protein YqhQ